MAFATTGAGGHQKGQGKEYGTGVRCTRQSEARREPEAGHLGRGWGALAG